MNDSDYEAAKDTVRGWVAHWQPILGLHDWSIDLEFFNGPIPGDPTACADVPIDQCHWAYQLATIRVNVPSLMNAGHPQPEEVLLHELLHITTCASTAAMGSVQDERTCTVLARALMHVRKL